MADDKKKKEEPLTVVSRVRHGGRWFKEGNSLVQREGGKKDGKILKRQDENGVVTDLTVKKEEANAGTVHSPKGADRGEGRSH